MTQNTRDNIVTAVELIGTFALITLCSAGLLLAMFYPLIMEYAK